MKFSNRTGWAVTPNVLAEVLQAKREAGVRVLDLTVSNPTRTNFRYLGPSILESLADPLNLTYEPDPHGILKAREVICGYYRKRGIKLAPDEIFLTASTSEAYTFVFRLLVNSHEMVLAPQPSYPLLNYLADLNDIEISRYQLLYDRGWRIDLEDLERKRRLLPSAILLVNPNNPTGNYVRKDERLKMNEICQHDKIALISDEVFFDFVLNRESSRPESFATNEDILTFTLCGLSKILGLPQMKISWIIVSGPQQEKDEAIKRLEVISDTYLSASTPSQTALRGWFDMLPTIQKEILERLQSNLEYLINKFKTVASVQLLTPEGGWYVVLEVPPSLSDEEWALHLLERDHTLVHPGYLFDSDEGNLLVLSLLPQPEIFREGIDRVVARFHQEAD